MSRSFFGIKPHRREKLLLYLILTAYFIFIAEIFLQSRIFGYSNSRAAVSVADGFHEILSSTGVNVYQKDYENADPDFVTVVDLRIATVRNLTGTVNGELIGRKLLTGFWQDAVDQNSENFKAQVVINGTFFGTDQQSATDIAFGLKARNHIITYGYGLNEYPGLNKTFAFNSFAANAQIQPYSNTTFDLTPDVIGALAAQANKSASSRLGRTFVGTIDTDQDSEADTVLFFSSAASTQTHAAGTLQAFGATDVAMLDGGGSTGLIVDGTAYIKTDRTLPHAIAIFADKPEDSIIGMSGRCLEANYPEITGDAQIRLSACNGSTTQRWSFRDSTLQGIGGKCLSVGDLSGGDLSTGDLNAGGSNAENHNSNTGKPIQFLNCNGSEAQRWTFAQGRFQSKGGQCLDAGGTDADHNISVQLLPCDQRMAQRWQRID
ncbi:MAG TPA: ricin-type beta-trefoil lectin domain protein [Coleofasciculaceae cyanobacterium]